MSINHILIKCDKNEITWRRRIEALLSSTSGKVEKGLKGKKLIYFEEDRRTWRK